MDAIELAALRKRAQAAGMPVGAIARAQRLKDGHLAKYRPSDPPRFRPPPATRLVTTDGVRRWVVAICRASQAWSVGEDLGVLGFRAYCPMGKRLIRGRRMLRTYPFAVFGRYIFVGEIQEPLAVSIHDGLVGIVGDQSGPWSLDPEIVKIINRDELDGVWDSTKPRPKRGAQHEDYVEVLQRYMKEHFR